MPASPVVLVIDDDAAFRADLSATLEHEGLTVALDARHGIETTHRIEALRPDIAFVAIEEPLARSLQTVAFCRELSPDVKVVAYTTKKDPKVLRRLMQLGVADVLPLPTSDEEIADAASRVVASGPSGGGGPRRDERSSARVIAVVGQKGGIGKTTISTNLAAAIAQGTPSSVLLIDLDTRFGDVGVMLDVQPEVTAAAAARDVSALDRETFREVLVQHESGAYVLAAPSHQRDWIIAEPAEVRALVDLAAQQFDCVILDTPGTMNPLIGAAIDMATHVTAVTTPDVTSVKNTDMLLRELQERHIPRNRVLIAMNHSSGGLEDAAERVERALQTRIDWQVPHDRAVARSAQLGTPIVLANPRSPVAENFFQLASRLMGRNVEAAPAAERNWGFLPRSAAADHGSFPQRLRGLVMGRA